MTEAAPGKTPSMVLAERGDAAVFGVVAALYALLALSAYELFGALTIGVTFFPPAGLTLACFVVLPLRRWPAVVAAIIVAEVVVDMAHGQTFGWAVAWAAANSVEPLVGAIVIRRLSRTVAFDTQFAWSLLTGGLLIGPAIGATIGATNLAIANDSSWLEGWADTWVGDALGVLVIAPVVLALGASVMLPPLPDRRKEIWLGAAMTAALAVVFFTTDNVPLGYVAIPLLAWAALRYGPRGLAIIAVAVASVATAATARDRGPWAGSDGLDAQTQLGRQQFFLLVAIGGAWVLALEVRRRDHAIEMAHDAQADLERALERTRLLDDVRRERDHVAALQAFTAALTIASTSDDVAAVVDQHAGQLIRGATAHLDLTTVPGEPGTECWSSRTVELPLRAGDRDLAVLRFDVPETVTAENPPRAQVRTIADLLAQALERARLHDAEQEQRALLTAINDALGSLGNATTVADVAATVERHGLAALRADALVLAVTDDVDDERLRVFTAIGDGPARAGEILPMAAEHPLATSARTGLLTFRDEPPDGAPDSRSWATLPLRAGRHHLGAIWFARRDPWTDPLRLRALSFASFVADALGRTRRSQLDHEVALTLQQALMPRYIAEIDSPLAGRYEPASGMLHVGGDWYDVIAGDDGAIAMVVGDVVGHGLAAAAVMGQLSSAARALAAGPIDPAKLLTDLDRMAARTPGAELTTVVCATFDRASRRLRYARAGHPPPVVRMPDGTAVVLDHAAGSPLCCGNAPRQSASIDLPPGALVVLYTDGLIEWRGSTLDARFEELAKVLADVDGSDPRSAVEVIVDRMSPEGRQTDDIAVLCLAVDRER